MKKELKLEGQTSLIVVAVGKAAADDFNGDLPKSRLSQEEIIDVI